MNNKKSVRAYSLDIRKKMSQADVLTKSSLISCKVCSLNEYIRSDIVLAYFGVNNEVETELIIQDAITRGKVVYLPKVSADSLSMDFYKIEDISELSPGYFGILEPSGLSDIFDSKLLREAKVFMLVPGVAFDFNLYRTGYGKGFYDRFLSNQENIYKCGICYELQLVENTFPDINDIKMDCIVSEDRILNGIN